MQNQAHDQFEYAKVKSAAALWSGEENCSVTLQSTTLNELPWRLTTDFEFLNLLKKLDEVAVSITKHVDIFGGIQTSAETKKTYWALVKNKPPKNEDNLIHFLKRNEKNNTSKAHLKEVPESKKASLDYKIIKELNNYFALEINLHTGRHHQIRAQLQAIGCPIKGDLKYGFDRSNPDGGIHLHARKLQFIHPVSKEAITLIAPTPDDALWNAI
ncbi:MAG: RNA pseudouridine synthase [Flavobacterium sp.]